MKFASNYCLSSEIIKSVLILFWNVQEIVSIERDNQLREIPFEEYQTKPNKNVYELSYFGFISYHNVVLTFPTNNEHDFIFCNDSQSINVIG